MAAGFVRRHPKGKSIWLYSSKGGSAAVVRDARWGDFLNIQEQTPDGWTKVRWGSKAYYIRTSDIANERPLEIIFLDVGQGDGCIVVSPETGDGERIFVIDAGAGDNMHRFVRWRFGKLLKRFAFHAAIITHPDTDHYKGFGPLFKHTNVHFENVYHNGILERADVPPFGPSDASGAFLSVIGTTQAAVEAIYSKPGARGRKLYPNLIHTALNSGRVGNVEMLHASPDRTVRTWMSGFAPTDNRSMTIEVLGPVPHVTGNGRTWLRWFGDEIGSNSKNPGKTKNGHSILLRVSIGGLAVLLGGDLNRPAEDYLLRHYGGIPAGKPLPDAVKPASVRLSADILKSCHHGASDVTDEFLRAVGAFAFVVSSGDDESHAHPRPDLLGRLGKHGRGEAPLLLCTELLRSTREKGRAEDFRRLRSLDDLIEDPATGAEDRKAARMERRNLQDRIQKRNVGVYGSVTLRTDGKHMEISFMLEKPRRKQRWQVYPYRFDDSDGWMSPAH